MPIPGKNSATPETRTRAQRVRPWLRALHRDAGYLAVGLTVIYAVSGLAVNHVADYTDGDASFVKLQRSEQLGPAGLSRSDGDARALDWLRARLSLSGTPDEPYWRTDTEIEVTFSERGALGGNSELHIVADLSSGQVDLDGKRPRWFVRFANWLHLNRGKKAWTYIADTYAVGLLFLALSGLFMIPGRKGLFFRGLLIAAIGAAIPAAYVVLAT